MRVIALAARWADRVVFSLGADPERLRWGIEEARRARSEAGLDPHGLRFGAYVNLVCHPQLEKARQLVSGGLASFARFSVMHGTVSGPAHDDQQKVLHALHRSYDMREHTRVGSKQTQVLTPEFIDRFAIVGSPESCIGRLQELAQLGIDRIIVIGPTAGAEPAAARQALETLAREVLPTFKPTGLHGESGLE